MERKPEIITFGRYLQNGDTPDPIEWYVLHVDKIAQKRLIISRCGLDNIPYHRVEKVIAWKDCFLRQWLNNEFLNIAFTAEEQERIVPYAVPRCDCSDYVFCLNETEFNEYLTTDVLRTAFNTKRIDKKFDVRMYDTLSSTLSETPKSWVNVSSLYCTYRLREDVHDNDNHSISYWIPGYCEVGDSPFVHMPSITWDTIAIRPAIWIKS